MNQDGPSAPPAHLEETITEPTPKIPPQRRAETAEETAERLDAIKMKMVESGFSEITAVGVGENAMVKGVRSLGRGGRHEIGVCVPELVPPPI